MQTAQQEENPFDREGWLAARAGLVGVGILRSGLTSLPVSDYEEFQLQPCPGHVYHVKFFFCFLRNVKLVLTFNT